MQYLVIYSTFVDWFAVYADRSSMRWQSVLVNRTVFILGPTFDFLTFSCIWYFKKHTTGEIHE